MYEVDDPTLDKKVKTLCDNFAGMCDDIRQFLHMDTSIYNVKERGNVINARPDSSASLRQNMAYGQLVEAKVFQQFDWGSDQANIEHYGTTEVPLLDLTAIKKVPISVYVGL